MHLGLNRSKNNWIKKSAKTEKKQYIQGLTGLKPTLTQRQSGTSQVVSKHHPETEFHPTTDEYTGNWKDHHVLSNTRFITVGNILWLVFFGWWLALVYAIVSLLLVISIIGIEYAKVSFTVAQYILWPFGKYVVEIHCENSPLSESSPLFYLGYVSEPRQEKDMAYYVWVFLLFIVVIPIELIVIGITWFLTVSIPISKVNFRLLQLLVLQPTNFQIKSDYSQSDHILLHAIEAINLNYASYSLLGVNIILFNAVPLLTIRVILLIVNMSIGGHLLNPVFAFVIDLVCTIPLTEFIGLSIESITLQTNYMVGALLNASFGSLTELILFSLAIKKGNLNDLILYSITGGLLNDTLLIPGISMVAAAIKYRTLKFNSKAAGVGSLLFYIALIGAFTPTMYYIAFNAYREECYGCYTVLEDNLTKNICEKCYYEPVSKDPIHDGKVAKLMYIVMVLLPFTYIIGMFFTFKTHSDIFQEDHEEEEGEEAEWTIVTAVVILSVSVLCFGLIAEDMIENVEGFIHQFNISQAFLGVTLMCLTPAVTEIASAVRFALAGQISLSIQIGSSSAIQVALIQMPLVTLIAILFGNSDEQFKLIFPMLNVFAVILAVFTLVFVSREGHTNYFIGSVLIVMYLMLISAFYFIPSSSHHTGVDNSTLIDEL